VTSSPPTVLQTVGQTVTLTNSVEGQPSTLAPSHSALPTPTSFLQNKVLSGFIFGLAGLIGLVLLTLVGTYFVRRKQISKLLNDAIKFDSPQLEEDESHYEDNFHEKSFHEKSLHEDESYYDPLPFVPTTPSGGFRPYFHSLNSPPGLSFAEPTQRPQDLDHDHSQPYFHSVNSPHGLSFVEPTQRPQDLSFIEPTQRPRDLDHDHSQ